MQNRKRAPRAPRIPTTPAAGSASRRAALAEELRTWCADRQIGPEEIDSDELQTWCIKHDLDPTDARRIIEFTARHGERSYCAGCEHCVQPAATASIDDDVRAVWDARFTLLGPLTSIADAELDAALAELDRSIKTLGRAVELAGRACELRSVASAHAILTRITDPDERQEALEDIEQQLDAHRDRERKASVARMFGLEIDAGELSGSITIPSGPRLATCERSRHPERNLSIPKAARSLE